MAPHVPRSTSRREFIARFAAIGAGAVGLPLMAACGSERPSRSSLAGAVVVASSSCTGHASLPPAQMQMRESLGYVDDGPTDDSTCSNCRFYDVAAAVAPCGACQLFQGPVSPGGWCRSWAVAT